MVVGAGAREAHEVVGRAVASGEATHVGHDLLFRDAGGQAERLPEPHRGGDLLEEGVH